MGYKAIRNNFIGYLSNRELDPFTIRNGFVVGRTYYAMSYIDKEGMYKWADLPNIILLKPSIDLPIMVSDIITAEKGMGAYCFSFTPTWVLSSLFNDYGMRDITGVAGVFKRAFKPERKEDELDTGDFIAYYFSTIFDNCEINLNCCDAVFHGNNPYARHMLGHICKHMPAQCYGLSINDKNKRMYRFRPNNEDLEDFVENALSIVSLF